MNRENLEGRDVSELNLIIGGFEEENADVIEQELNKAILVDLSKENTIQVLNF